MRRPLSYSDVERSPGLRRGSSRTRGFGERSLNTRSACRRRSSIISGQLSPRALLFKAKPSLSFRHARPREWPVLECADPCAGSNPLRREWGCKITDSVSCSHHSQAPIRDRSHPGRLFVADSSGKRTDRGNVQKPLRNQLSCKPGFSRFYGAVWRQLTKVGVRVVIGGGVNTPPENTGGASFGP
jgi:hypothetical protein